jgi:carbohydrate-selective porin OprB
MAQTSTNAQDRTGNSAPQNVPASSQASAGLLPIPNYSADFWTRRSLSGDWGGVRTTLANKGIQFGLQWNQYVQGVTDGGRDRTTHYGGDVVYSLSLDPHAHGRIAGGAH